MTLDEIKQLIEFIKGQELTEFELEQDGFKIRIKSGQGQVAAVPHMPASVPMMAPQMEPVAAASAPAATPVALRDARQPPQLVGVLVFGLARPGRALRGHDTHSHAPVPVGRSATPTPPVED